jgi:excisionase family DNA binding protein
MSEDRLITAAEVAAKLQVPTSWVYSAARSGALPAVTLGRYRRFRREAIELWLQRNENAERLPEEVQ